MSFGAIAASYAEDTGPWLYRSALSSSSVDQNGTADHTCTFRPATEGSLLVAIMAGAVTFTTPDGWTLVTSVVADAGLYVFAKTAAAGESSFTTTHNGSDYAIRGVVYEFPGTATVLGSNYQLNASDGAISGPSVTGLTGTYTVFAACCVNLTRSTGTMNAVWTAPATAEYQAYVGRNGTDGIGLSTAYQEGMSGGSFTCTYDLTRQDPGIGNSNGIAFALSS